jgi:hypothetical protein
MSTSNIVPTADQMTDPNWGSTPSVDVSQTPPQPDAAQPSQPATPAQPPSDPLANYAGDTPSGGGSRLGAILGAVAKTVSTSMSGISAGGRPSFAGGLGQGSRAAQQAQAVAQDIKFKTFDDSVRAANLHNQDLELQMRTQEQQDAHQKSQDFQSDWDDDHGISYDPHPNDGQAVIDTLKGQTQATGAATIPAGTHLSADGKSINQPTNDDSTAAGLLAKYKQLQGPMSLPALPQNAQIVPQKMLDIMTHKLSGFKADGSPWGHDDLPQQISALQSQRDAVAKNGANPYQLGTMDNTIKILQSNQDALDKHAASVEQQKAQSKKAGEITADMSPEGRALAQANANLAMQKQDNAAGNKAAAKPQSTDWNPGVGADEKKKAELAENIAFNANEVAKIVMNRPDILGAVAGRYTNAEQMIGNNDPDISALGVHVHNMAMANSGVHGFRSQEGVESYERQLLNNFKNGPAAMAGALRASTGSVQTFVDNARPQSYKTHSNQGGAVKGMMQSGAQQ